MGFWSRDLLISDRLSPGMLSINLLCRLSVVFQLLEDKGECVERYGEDKHGPCRKDSTCAIDRGGCFFIKKSAEAHSELGCTLKGLGAVGNLLLGS